MSFCSDVKNELLNLRLSGCCRSAYVYGFMLFGRSFSIQRIALQTGSEAVAKGYREAVSSLYGITPRITAGGTVRPTYVAEVVSEGDRLKILASRDFGISETVIDRDIFLRECCFASFVRGAFLACGNVNDPEKEYRAEFNIKNEKTAGELQKLLAEKGIALTLSASGNGFRLYTKDSASVEDLLALMGASHTTLELMDTKILKSVKNNINRARNCDGANIGKTVEASIRQRQAIAVLEKAGRLESLPQELLQAALMRKANPDATLKELCRLSEDSITVSGLNHRLEKLVRLAEELKKK